MRVYPSTFRGAVRALERPRTGVRDGAAPEMYGCWPGAFMPSEEQRLIEHAERLGLGGLVRPPARAGWHQVPSPQGLRRGKSWTRESVVACVGPNIATPTGLAAGVPNRPERRPSAGRGCAARAEWESVAAEGNGRNVRWHGIRRCSAVAGWAPATVTSSAHRTPAVLTIPEECVFPGF